MTFPENISTVKVVGRFLAGRVGAPTVTGSTAVPARVTVDFVPEVSKIPAPAAAPAPVTFYGGGLPGPVRGVLDYEGYLCTPDPENPDYPSQRGVYLIATDDESLAVMDWTWRVTVKADGRVLDSYPIAVPQDAVTLDLTLTAPVPSSEGYGLPQAEAAVAAASSAAVASAGSAQDAEDAAGRAETYAAGSVTAGTVTGDNLILTRHNGQTLNAGNVRGRQGEPGPNTVPTDQAIATNLTTPGTDTHTAADQAVAGFITGDTQSKQALDGVLNGQFNTRLANANKVSYSTEYVPAAAGYPAHYVTKVAGGTKGGSIVRKFTTDDSLSPTPPRSTLDQRYAKHKAQILINATGYRLGGWWENQLIGLQIKDGTIIKGWDNEPDEDRGREAVVFMRDGSLRIYDETVTPEQVVAEGGWNSFSWGAAVYREGAVTGFRQYARYAVISGRQLIGDDTAGNLLIVTVPGVTDVSGAVGDHMVAIGERLGVRNLYILDGGGSAQTMVGGQYLVASSDGAPRPTPDALAIYAPSSGPYLDTGWVPLVLAAGFAAEGSPAPAVRKQDGKTMIRGLVKPTSGDFPTTTVKVADFPPGFAPAYWVYRRTASSSMAVTAQVVARSGTGGIELNHSSTGSIWTALDPVEWTN
ncbi:phosphodiester glycosidase family protein [Arthrobacter sp. VKM Ac-2550]|uniref:phosphodiester glycosidase family protein n=1 Tax=Crystallibacter permensis TaxID=1938888 RepID=UPI00222754FC|nr:phosphodiester glycosidase family protein [Arthrobacter sp. VKM Ac-2550]MCW2132876.1 putative protein (DUF2233) [Arthrobacter sp. VKM Ac-2550]